MATNGRKRYFHIDENASSEQIYALLDDVESADEDDIDNLMNDSDTEIDNLIGNDGIQNTMIRNRFCEILQNLHFADNRKDDKTDKAFKMRPVIDHLNSKFSKVL